MSDASAGSKFYQKTISKENQGIPRNIKRMMRERRSPDGIP